MNTPVQPSAKLADSNIIVTAYRSSDASLSMWDIHGTVGHAVTESEQVHYQSLNGGIVVQTLYDANDDATNAHARADAGRVQHRHPAMRRVPIHHPAETRQHEQGRHVRPGGAQRTPVHQE